MEAPAYEGEGGVGGKSRRRPFRRSAASATPYSRPSSAARGGSRGFIREAAAPGGSGWLSRFVDPASRFIAGTASRLFSSVFQKRLTAAPQSEDPGTGLVTQTREETVNIEVHSQIRQVDAAVVSAELLHDTQDDKGINQGSPTHNYQKNGISEFEEMLKQKTFTRAEFEHLTEMLRSRIINPDASEAAPCNERLDFQPKNVVEDPRPQGDLRKPLDNLAIPEDEAASPAELAKAFMGSRSIKLPSSALRLQNRAFYEEKARPNGPKPFELSVNPRSVLRFTDAADHSEIGYLTPRPLGRSEIFRTSRSSYSRAQAISDMKGGGFSKDNHAGVSSLTFQTPKSILQSGGRQVMKRRSSVLDGDLGSFVPVRRIRQKSSIISSVRGTPAVLSENITPSPSTAMSKDVIGGISPVQKPLQLDEQNCRSADLREVEKGYKRKSNSNVNVVPPQSSEMAKKIFQELGKLVPSPREKSSKTILLNESPIKLVPTVEGHALRNIGNSDASWVKASESNIGSVRDSANQVRTSLSHKQHRGVENGPSMSDALGVESTAEANRMHSIDLTASHAMPSKNGTDGISSNSHKKLAFQITASEVSFKTSNGVSIRRDALSPLNPSNKKVEMKVPQDREMSTRTARPVGSLMPASIGIPSHSSIDTKSPVAENGMEFTFPVAPAPSTHAQPPPTPTMPAAIQENETAAPLFSFGSDTRKVAAISTSSAGFANPDNSARSALASSTFQSSELDKGSEARRSRIVFKYSGDVVSTAKQELAVPVFSFGARKDECASCRIVFKTYESVDSTIRQELPTPIFAFGARKDEGASNGSLYSSSSLSFSAAGALTTSASSTTSSASASYSSNISTAAPMLSTVPLFKFASTTSEEAPSVAQPLVKSGTTFLEDKSAKPLLFNTASAPSRSGFIASTGLMVASSFSSTGSSSDSAASVATSNMGSSTTALLPSTVLSNKGGSQSSQAPSLAFSGADKSIFKFGSSPQSSSSSLLVTDSGSKTSAASGFSFGSQASTSESGISHFCQILGNESGSFSSPSLGLVNASSTGFGSSQVGVTVTVSQPFVSTTSPFSAGPAPSKSTTNFSLGQSGTTGMLAYSAQSSSSVFGSAFGSTSSAPATVFSFGATSSGPGISPFLFGSSSGSLFSLPSTSTMSPSTSSSAQPVVGSSTAVVSFSSKSPSNDQMNVEDNMAEETNHAATPASGQQGHSPSIPVFGSPAVQPAATIFQFGSQQTSIPSSSSPFQAAGDNDLTSGFSLGSGGGDKSGRRISKVRHNRLSKK